VKALRLIAIVAAIVLMAGEGYRSWGQGRPVFAWLDDMLAGTMMIAAAIMVGRPTRTTRAFFSAAWGVAVGMLDGSFFSKLANPGAADPGNFPVGLLTALLGIAFVLAILGLIASIVLPDPDG
jgi:hypothetical protein